MSALTGPAAIVVAALITSLGAAGVAWLGHWWSNRNRQPETRDAVAWRKQASELRSALETQHAAALERMDRQYQNEVRYLREQLAQYRADELAAERAKREHP